MTKFERDDGYVRYDFAWVGFGFCPRTIFYPSYRAQYYWVNVYRRFPLPYWAKKFFEIHFGLLEKTPFWKRTWLHFEWHGLKADTFTFYLGRFFFGGRTPEWLRKLVRKRDEWRHFKWYEQMEREMEIFSQEDLVAWAEWHSEDAPRGRCRYEIHE